ncbi:trypsin-like peptidase domain-containing protein [Phycicoccus sp. 3266]|uniref:trypsin-like peptidase domain-containing protein n=1 Tax=Phycicoccus sp. 3266 TaxID=2817751 RepID=UPI0028572D7E|nr:trypsin-like peptidase domain-containing protein [Phycicoccus sp. 3266]MDR6864032.1 putative serine protease PepD [Phycicoccus sp. 3266]
MTNERDPEASPQGADDERAAAPADPAPAVEPQDTQPVQAPDHWDPWAPPRPVEHTQPVDLSHTRELGASGAPAPTGGAAAEPAPWTPTAGAPASAQGEPTGGSQAEATPQPVWAQEPTGWPTQASAHQQPSAQQPSGQEPSAQQPSGQEQPAHPQGASAAGLPGSGWDPITAPSADAGYAGSAAPWSGAHPVPATAPQQKGPGWGALVAVAAAAALVAAVLGGMFGGWLGATDRVDFGRLDRAPSSIPTAGTGSTARPEGSIPNIAAKALPSVVTIKVRGADGAGTGSGFVLDRDGHIITNNHVVASAANNGTIKIELSNGSEIAATIVGRDASYDLAVLKTERTGLEPLTMGASKDVVVGDQVIAVGAPLGLESTVTSGIVSALNRPVSPGGDGDQQSYINAIQTDAAINPGNSGGPLLNMRGEVIGVNSAIARIPGSTDTQSGNIGVGFSIPSDQVVKTAEQLIKTGSAQHPVIGVVLDRQYTGDGVRVLPKATSDSGDPVDPSGPAGKAGVKAGDIIVEFDGRKVTSADDLVVAIRAKSVGDRVSMTVRRGSETIEVTLTLAGKSGS